MPRKKRKKFKHLMLPLLLVIIIASGGFYYWYYIKNASLRDEFFNEAMRKIPEIQSYSQHVETKTQLKDRKIRVSGNYDIDKTNKKFNSSFTTTLFILDMSQGNQNHSFTLENISIGKDIYIKIGTDSEFLKSITKTNGWEHYTARNVPPKYSNIAVTGPIIDNLQLFTNNGRYIKVTDKAVIEEDLLKYSLKLSEKAFTNKGSQILGTLAERISKNGIINVWIDQETLYIKKMEFKNDPYWSLTEISNINSVPDITPPL